MINVLQHQNIDATSSSRNSLSLSLSKGRPLCVWYLAFTVFFSFFNFGCDAGISPDGIGEMVEADVGPIFFEPTLDMRLEIDQGMGEVSRILGGFGDACDSNLDCADNWCVSAGEESLCTYTCPGGDCPNGWSCRAVSNNSQDVTLICVPQEERLCKPCETNADCPTGACYNLDGEQVCGSNCERDEECSEGYSCVEIGAEGETLCTPNSRSCSCDASKEGEVRICENLTDEGICYGRQTCGGFNGWSICDAQAPMIETCNQIDDDCNGITDDLPNIGETCRQEAMVEGELRVCEGITLCVVGTEAAQCSASLPQAELCNFRDDDCDGTVDEGFEARDQSCVVGVGACQRYGVMVCNETLRPEEETEEEWTSVICNVVAGEPDLEERCDGLDNDCDGQTDEDYPSLGEICTVGEGFCRQSSVTRCDPSGLGVICEVSEGQGEVERCDGADNDCDGLTDEDFTELNNFCTEGVGICQRRGLSICSEDGFTLVCSVNAAEPEVESCDNRDNDCDGLTDEGFPPRGEACLNGEGACQAVGVTRCDDEGAMVICSARPTQPTAESCDQLDNDCDGLVDESFDLQAEPCIVGQGLCQSVGVTQCDEDGAGVSCSANPGLPVEERCDNLDNDCDGIVDEAFATLGLVCNVGEGLCRQSGVVRCTPEGDTAQCSVMPSEPTDELCDGADNDCDGAVDETFSELNTICEVGEGVCQRRGMRICANQGIELICSVDVGQAEEERCDDLDNDCDGSIDEGFALRGEPCVVGIGVCQAVGITRCDEAGAEVICSATPNLQGEELCDNLDNDCDGLIDEDYLTLNEVCSEGDGVCRSNGVNRCAQDQQGVICSVTAGIPSEESCDNLDNDCDGLIDEAFAGLNDFCTEGEGICQRRGLLVCAQDGLNIVCNVNASESEAELCDDLDNDCDGFIDEGYPPRGIACVDGVGACESVAVTRCDEDGRGVSCSANASAPNLERCDSLDNDCDGEIDEDYPTLGNVCTDGVGACRQSSVTRCDPNGDGVICEVSLHLGEDELCDGVDNDCDDNVDEDFEVLNTSCTVGRGICQRRGLNICSNDGLTEVCSVSPAAPEQERCDDLDNDCDGLIDEGYEPRGEACVVGDGVCQKVGVTRCGENGEEVVCSATAGEAEVERCDALDNDCDGQVDEGFALRGEACSIGVGTCQSNGVTRCSDDTLGVVCSVEEGESSPERCDGLDNDCDGLTDEDFDGRGEACLAGVGSCQTVGVIRCAENGEDVLCSASPSEPSDERCDSLDNDCDGTVDEGYAELGVVCDVGVGLCRQSGVNRCSANGLTVSCSVTPLAPTLERCDNLDNDCDDEIDESFPELNELCSEGVGICQRRGLKVCAEDALTLTCSVVAAAPEIEICDDLDNDCDGTVDEAYGTKGDPCLVGQGICQVVGVNRCNEQGDGLICSAAPGEPAIESCDALDNDCDGIVDESHPLLNTRCTVGQGLCLRSGVYQCNESDVNALVICDAEIVAGDLIDTCDYQDDDCDGIVDEEFITDGEYLSLNNCGACGSDCTTIWVGGAGIYNVTPTCEIINELTQCSYECLAGYYDLDGLSNNGCEFNPDQEAIYVKPVQYGGEDIVGCGGFNTACATLNYAVQVAQTLSKSRLRVSEGVYREMFEIPNGFEILGGHQQNSWVRSPEVSTSHIDARGLVNLEIHRYGVVAREIDQPTLLDGFLITADTPILEGNSYGIYIVDSDENLVIANNRIVSGDGGRGRNGALGINGSNGIQGATGSNSYGISDPLCNGTQLNDGGFGGIKVCSGVIVSGGGGADSICPVFDEPAGIATDGFGANPGALGVTAYAFYSEDEFSCTVGSGPRDAGTGGVGANGNDGAGAVAALSAQGQINNQHWIGVNGQAGTLANPGSGGGGGGGAAGVEILYTSDPAYDVGATGGGGGSGGCGGSGGAGGESGGGSFGVLITYSIPVNDLDDIPIIQDNVITRGFGGSGGTGGPGGPGGRGGLPGLGGVSGSGLYQGFCSLQGGDGGKGGDGGNGGGGAGGQGGASYDFYIHNTSSLSPSYDVLNISLVGREINTGGAGGVGGISANVEIGLGASGLDGVSDIIYID
jgi:Notch 1